jgi:hypothetical protein
LKLYFKIAIILAYKTKTIIQKGFNMNMREVITFTESHCISHLFTSLKKEELLLNRNPGLQSIISQILENPNPDPSLLEISSISICSDFEESEVPLRVLQVVFSSLNIIPAEQKAPADTKRKEADQKPQEEKAISSNKLDKQKPSSNASAVENDPYHISSLVNKLLIREDEQSGISAENNYFITKQGYLCGCWFNKPTPLGNYPSVEERFREFGANIASQLHKDFEKELYNLHQAPLLYLDFGAGGGAFTLFVTSLLVNMGFKDITVLAVDTDQNSKALNPKAMNELSKKLSLNLSLAERRSKGKITWLTSSNDDGNLSDITCKITGLVKANHCSSFNLLTTNFDLASPHLYRSYVKNLLRKLESEVPHFSAFNQKHFFGGSLNGNYDFKSIEI